MLQLLALVLILLVVFALFAAFFEKSSAKNRIGASLTYAEKLKQKREKQEQEVDLSRRLKNFLEMNQRSVDVDPAFTKEMVDDPSPEKKEDQKLTAICYSFKSEAKLYRALLYLNHYRPRYDFDIETHDSGVYYDIVDVFCNPNDRVFQAKLYFSDSNWRTDCSSKELEAFIPGPWVQRLDSVISNWETASKKRMEQYYADRKLQEDKNIIKNFGG